MIKLDDTNGQLRKECQKLKMELEQSIAENNLFGSLNSEMKKLMSSMLDYCKQHESDIKRYKRKHEEIEEDIRFSKAMPPVKIKCDKLIQLVRYREFQRRRLKEKEAAKDKIRTMPPPKELRSLRESSKDLSSKDTTHSRELIDSKDMINAKELQHIQHILNTKDAKHCRDLLQKESQQSKEFHSKLSHKDPLSSRDLLYKEFLHPKETLHKDLHPRDPVQRDLLSAKELSHCKELTLQNTKIMYSKEVLRSKELLKERYLRDCTKMKLKEIPKDQGQSTVPEKLADPEKEVKTHKSDEQSETVKNNLKSGVKEASKDSEKITVRITIFMSLYLGSWVMKDQCPFFYYGRLS